VVRWVKAVGPVVRVELARAGDATPVEAEIAYERQGQLKLAVGEQVYVGYDRVRSYGFEGGAGI
jgi:hypothetical protein